MIRGCVREAKSSRQIVSRSSRRRSRSKRVRSRRAGRARRLPVLHRVTAGPTGEVAAVERVKRVLAPLSSSSRIITAVVVAVRRQVTLGTHDEAERQTGAPLALCAAIHDGFIFLVMNFRAPHPPRPAVHRYRPTHNIEGQ